VTTHSVIIYLQMASVHCAWSFKPVGGPSSSIPSIGQLLFIKWASVVRTTMG